MKITHTTFASIPLEDLDQQLAGIRHAIREAFAYSSTVPENIKALMPAADVTLPEWLQCAASMIDDLGYLAGCPSFPSTAAARALAAVPQSLATA